MPKVNPKILTWARETAGFSLEDAAHAIDLKESRGIAGAERLAILERGEDEPSRAQLVRMADKYHRPLLAFYLAEPPPRGDRGEDFRTLPGTTSEFDPQLDALIRDVRARHGLVKSLLEDDDTPTHRFVGSQTMKDGVDKVAKSIVAATSFDIVIFRKCADVSSAFRYLRSTLEESGIFVLLIGNLGSHHSTIGPNTFRGFAIADPIAPFIVINDQDAPAAWAFTALHEAAHLWLGTSGVSGSSSEVEIERFCNNVASSILLAKSDLSSLRGLDAANFREAIDRISQFADARNLSRRMVSYQLLRFQEIDNQLWQALTKKFDADWSASKLKASEDKGKQSGGPNYYVVKRHRLGHALVALVTRSLQEGALTYSKAAQVLGVNPRTVESLLRYEPARGGV
jgi:Zn-dependent peptidase ImmA (M78 family)/transcriptional regulator with XRE-family HTH domain